MRNQILRKNLFAQASVAAGAHEVEFLVTLPVAPGPQQFLTNLTASEASVSEAPELPTWSMSLAGFVGIGFAARRSARRGGVAA